tara:strand:- start:3125 stop:3853 length:729 start_codon:yes stop_codon:yes gene_type:complete
MSIEEIRSLCVKYSIEDYIINDDGSIDVEHNVDLSYALSNMNKLPLKFNKVDGNFGCFNNNLETLEGSPKYVKGTFDCSGNKLTSLKYCPEKVDKNFICSDNIITSLEGCPQNIEGLFYCHFNKLTTLKGGPESISKDFSCWDNHLISLEGCPKYVGGDFNCEDNKITDLKESPKYVGGDFNCVNNPIGFISDEIDIEFIRAFNTFKVLKDNTINLKRLKYIMGIFDKPIIIGRIKIYYKIK